MTEIEYLISLAMEEEVVGLSAELTAAIWWSTILLLKLATFGPLVGMTRIKRKVFANPEDCAKSGVEVKMGDVVVERRRR